jgi:hypothetical protein
MDRRYYLTKFAVVAVAVALALASSGIGSSRNAHPSSTHSAYSAPAQVQAAAWNATIAVGHTVGCVISRTLHSVLHVTN